MDVFTVLAGGDRRSTGASDQVAEHALANPEIIENLLTGVVFPDAIVRSRSAHALMLICTEDPELLQPYKQRLLAELAPQKQWELREQFSKIFPSLALTREDVDAAIEVFKDYLEAKQSIVKTCALQGLFDLIRFDPSMKPQIKALIELYAIEGTPAMRARCRILLKKL